MKTSRKLPVLYLLLLLVISVSLLAGRYELSLKDILLIIIDRSDSQMAANVFYNIRLPRTIEVVLCGMALAVSGFLYQSSFHNALVSPDTLGVSGGASIGAIISILYLKDGFLLRQLSAFAGGILAVFFSLFLAGLIGQNKRISLLLVGVITGALANSAIMAFKYLADPTTQLAVIDYWLMGSFSLIDQRKLIATAIIIVPILLITILLRFRLKALLLNEEEALTLGINVRKLYYLCIGLSTLLTATAVSVSGIVSWIGLLAPHIVNILTDAPFEDALLFSLPVGGIILLLADILSRTLTISEIPISIITSLIGALVLLVFLIRRRSHD